MQSPQEANNLVRERDTKIKIKYTKFDKSNDRSKITTSSMFQKYCQVLTLLPLKVPKHKFELRNMQFSKEYALGVTQSPSSSGIRVFGKVQDLV